MVMAPLNPADLVAGADLAGCARVIEVGCLPPFYFEVAKLKFYRIIKGKIKAPHGFFRNLTYVGLRGESRGPGGEVMLGGWSDHYAPGTKVLTHLTWDEETRTYRTYWWNAVSVLD